jgi:geranylgeranyl transferase type-2 subunit beta
MTVPYLARLLLRLSTGLERISTERRAKHIGFLRSKQQPDGGFSGRQGGSDLYYTSFALRGLAVLGALDSGIARHSAAFLRQQMRTQVPLIDLIALVFSAHMLETAAGIDLFAESDAAWPDTLAALFGQLRCADGGYARSTEGGAGSTYQTFLAVLIHQQLGRPLPDPRRVADFVRSQQRDDGGYVEIRVMRRSGTNPTAAAVGTLHVITSWLDPTDTPCQSAEPVASFLSGMQTGTGGFRANRRIPLADLLSTYTGLQALCDLDCLHHANMARAECYIASLEQPGGGWYAAEWDETIDVEYTFYGLAALGLVLGAW